MLIALLVFLGFLLLMLASGAYIFCVACCRTKNVNWLDEKAVEGTPFAEHYSKIVACDRWLKESGCRDIFVTASDGIRLHALWVNATDAKGTAILFHGYRSTPLVDFSMILEFYHSAGYNLLIPDQRAHGESEGRFITFGVKESDDVLHWVEFHNRTFGAIPVVLCGLSMGASTVLYTADRELPQNVKGIIADCGFTSPNAIISAVYKRTIHLPPVLSMWAVDLFARALAGFSINDKDTRITLKNSHVPVLMVHGGNDGFVPCQMSEDGYQACAGKKKLLIVDGADHGVSFIHDREGYTQAVVTFLEENIPQ